jgi:hypothetical protein
MDWVVGEPSTTLPLKVPGTTTVPLAGLLAAGDPAPGEEGEVGAGAGAAAVAPPEEPAGAEPPPQPVSTSTAMTISGRPQPPAAARG